MGQYTQWIDYKGKKILISDYSGLKAAEYVQAIEETKWELLNQQDKAPLSITDISDTFSTDATSAKGKELIAEVEGNGIKGKAALVGVTGVKRILVQAIKKDVFFANSIEEAKEWLVKEEKKQ
jgi:hypothetical protein